MVADSRALIWQGFFAIAMFLATFVSYLLPIIIFTRRNKRLFEPSNLNQEEEIHRPHHWSTISSMNLATQLKKLRLKRLLSYCNCVSAGVFLGVCFLNLIPCVEEEFANLLKDFDSLRQLIGTYPLGQFTVILGLFLVLILENLLARCFETKHQHDSHHHSSHSPVPILYLDEETIEARHEDHEQEELLLGEEGRNNGKQERRDSVRGNGRPRGNQATCNGEVDHQSVSNSTHHHHHHHHYDVEMLASRQESMLTFFILMFATSIHSLFEGLALGLQSDLKTAIHLFIGIILHECLVALALGLNAVRLQQHNLQMKMHIKFAIAFSLTIPAGNILGILLGYTPGHFGRFISAIFQGFAAGTFIHVTFIELIPEEFLSNDCDSNKEDELNRLFQDSKDESTHEVSQNGAANNSTEDIAIVDHSQVNFAPSHVSHPTSESGQHTQHSIKLCKILLLLLGFILMALVPLIFPG